MSKRSASEAGNGTRLPPQFEAILDALKSRPDVQVAYLFGSTARQEQGPLSDLDIAVLLDHGPDIHQRHLDLIADISTVTGATTADVVLLNEAPPALAFRVLRDGELLSARDEKVRIRHWVSTVQSYIDTMPLRRALDQGLRHRIAEGRFGRS